MSYIVNARVAPLCHSQDHLGGVPITTGDVSTAVASESSFVEPESLLGSHEATRTRHRRKCGLNYHHLTARPLGSRKQFAFGGSYRRVRGLTSQRRLSKELRLEAFDGDQLMLSHNTVRPHPRSVTVLPSSLLLQASGFAARPRVAVGWLVTSWAPPPGHLPLGPSKLGGASLPVATVRQIEFRIRRGRGHGHSPIDTEGSRPWWEWLDLTTDHERRISVAQRILVDANRRGGRRQITRPNHGDHDALGQPQTTIHERESVTCALQRRQGILAPFDLRPTTTFDRERLVQSDRVGAEHLLLSNSRSVAQPDHPSACISEKLSEFRQRRLPSGTLLVDRLVPNESATVPLGFEYTRSARAWAQPVRVAHRLDHTFEHSIPLFQSSPWTWASTTAMLSERSSSAVPSTYVARARHAAPGSHLTTKNSAESIR